MMDSFSLILKRKEVFSCEIYYLKNQTMKVFYHQYESHYDVSCMSCVRVPYIIFLNPVKGLQNRYRSFTNKTKKENKHPTQKNFHTK